MVLEDLGATRPSFELLRRAGGPFGPFLGPSAPSSVAEGAKEDILDLVSPLVHSQFILMQQKWKSSHRKF